MTPRWRLPLSDTVVALAFAPQTNELAAATYGGPILCVAAHSGEVRAELPGHPGGNLSVAFSPDGALLASTGIDRTVRVDPRGAGGAALQLDAGAEWVGHVAWTSDGACLAAAARRSVRLWSVRGELRGEYDQHQSTVSALVWYEPRQSFITACYGMVQLLGRARLELVAEHQFRASILGVVPSPDLLGPYIALPCQDPLVHVWDMRDDDNEINLLGYRSKVDVVTWNERAPLLATAGGDAVVLWGFGRTGATSVPLELRQHKARVRALRFTGSGIYLFSSADDGRTCIYDSRDFAALPGPREVIETPHPVTALVPVPGGMAWATAAGQLGVWPWEG